MSVILNNIALIIYALIVIFEGKYVREHASKEFLNIRLGLLIAAVVVMFASFIFTILK